MTEPPYLTVLDVGHGNCAMLVDGEHLYVIDIPSQRRLLVDALKQRGLAKIDALLLSHGDADHIGGAVGLLVDPEIHIGRVYLNSETDRSSAEWTDLRVALSDARKRDENLRIHVELTSATTEQLQLPRIRIDVLAPSPEIALSGAGGKDLDGRPLEANTMSAVLKASRDGSRGVLLAGDIDGRGLDYILADGGRLDADVLVFPHHGGRPGSEEPEAFARRLCEAVGPETVIFSFSRGHKALPRADILRSVRSICPDVQIACTELSAQCSAVVPPEGQPYLSELPARAKARGACCAGSIELIFQGEGLERPQLQGHARYVTAHVERPLCRPG